MVRIGAEEREEGKKGEEEEKEGGEGGRSRAKADVCHFDHVWQREAVEMGSLMLVILKCSYIDVLYIVNIEIVLSSSHYHLYSCECKFLNLPSAQLAIK